ncbi:MAG: hypothetical protein GWP50_10930 [Proteobacteria bacterium]|nr:hypothetical protein [Pseudomonadota bacterium]
MMNAIGAHAERLPQGSLVESTTVMTPPTDKLEAQTREEIDTKLVTTGWGVKGTFIQMVSQSVISISRLDEEIKQEGNEVSALSFAFSGILK